MSSTWQPTLLLGIILENVIKGKQEREEVSVYKRMHGKLNGTVPKVI